MGIYKLTHKLTLLTLYRCGTKHTKPESWQTQPRFKRGYQIIDLERERERERERVLFSIVIVINQKQMNYHNVVKKQTNYRSPLLRIICSCFFYLHCEKVNINHLLLHKIQLISSLCLIRFSIWIQHLFF